VLAFRKLFPTHGELPAQGILRTGRIFTTFNSLNAWISSGAAFICVFTEEQVLGDIDGLHKKRKNADIQSMRCT